MIQRIQTIYLLLSAFVFGSLFIIPFAISDQPAVPFLSDGDYDVNDHAALLALTVLGIILSFVAIFLFRKRKLQLRFGYLIIVVAILIPAVAFILFTQASPALPDLVDMRDQFGLFLPALAILFSALANRAITKDEKLVKSMDRLR